MTAYEKIINELKRISKDKRFNEIFNLLYEGDYGIKIYLENTYKWDDFESIPLGYFYDKSFIEPGKEYHKLKQDQKRFSYVKPEQFSKDIENIFVNLERLDATNFFIELASIQCEYIEERENDYIENLFQVDGEIDREAVIKKLGLEDYLAYCDLKFSVKDICILTIEKGDPYFDSSNLKRDIEEYLNLRNRDADIMIIPSQGWFEGLDDESKSLIIAGTQYIEEIYFKLDRDFILDYTPLLLDFIKACEVEVFIHIDKYRNDIINISLPIIELENKNKLTQKFKKIREEKNIPFDSEYEVLYNILDSIRRRKERFKHGGIKIFQYVIKYLALLSKITSNGLDTIFLKDYIKSYLPRNKSNLVKKDEELLERIKRLNAKRNKYLHRNILPSDKAFRGYYSDLCILLEFLTELNS